MGTDQPDNVLRLAVDVGSEWTVVHASGDLDYSTQPQFRSCIDQLLSNELIWIGLDLSAMDFCDSVGLSCFVAAWKGARGAGGDLVLLRPAEPVRRVLEITGFGTVVAILDELPGREPHDGRSGGTPTP